HRGEVEHHAAVAGPVPKPAVPTAADRELQAGIPRQVDSPDDVGVARGANDHRRTRVLAIEDDAGLVVPGVIWSDGGSGQLPAQVIDRDRTGGRGLVHRASPPLSIAGARRMVWCRRHVDRCRGRNSSSTGPVAGSTPYHYSL